MPYAHIHGFVIAFVLALFIVPVVRRICLKKGIVDIPNERKVHKIPIPRLGGVAIWLCTILTFVILVFINWDYPYGNGLSGILVGGSIMFLLGLVDDLYDLSPKFKLVVQIGAALIAFLLGVRIEVLFNPFGGAIHLGIFSLPITLIWLVGISNAMNFIDGVDGLAGGVSAICAVTLAVVAFYTNQPISAVLASILAGSMMGFLVFNFHPARIFMGDSGALFSGFALAGLSVAGVLKSLTATMLLPILILVVPIMDISFSVFRRVLKGTNPMKADSEHIHHKLLQAGFSHNRTAAILYLVCAGAGSAAAILVGAQRVYLTILVIVFLFMLLLARIAKLRKMQDFDKLQELNEQTQEEFQV
jgi:UDP-GlcNAc:undecaprenyl-phosphate GlcNAc-1-phosphate transferase